jgi:hypothetical protein
MKTLKNFTLLSCLVLGLSLLTFSCKKDKAASLITLDTSFFGNFTVTGGPETYPIAFTFYKDNTLIVFTDRANSQNATGTGTYTITNNVLKAEISIDAEPGVIYLFTATFTNTAFTNGTWGTSPSYTDGGEWEMALTN